MSLLQEVRSLSPSAEVCLFELNLEPNNPATDKILYFHNGTNKLNTAVIWKGKTYNPWPISVEGFSTSTQGTLPRPRLSMSNKGGLLTYIAVNFNSMRGSKLVRRRTHARFLDAANFPGGVNPDADPTQEFPIDEYDFCRKIEESKIQVVLEYRCPFDQESAKIPRRAMYANLCSWTYRDETCGYTGAPVTDDEGNVITITPNNTSSPYPEWLVGTNYVTGDVVACTDQSFIFIAASDNVGMNPFLHPQVWKRDKCFGQYGDCVLRKRVNNVIPIGCFPGLLKVPQV